MSADIQFHEAANIFPLDESHIEELARDIKEHGQKETIRILGGKILDGRRRWKACRLAGIIPTTEEVETDDPVAYVLSLNLYRRHLDTGQRAMVAARARAIYDRAAKERMKAGGGDHKSGRANLPPPIPDQGRSRDQAAKAVNVGGRTVDYATKVLKNGTQELVAAVDSSELPISAAAEIAKLPKSEQLSAIEEKKKTPRKHKTDGCERIRKPGKQASSAIYLVTIAISQLTRIKQDDPERKKAFAKLKHWIQENE